ncbi:hypothetical protein Bbelb_016970 [Branchiostoma belcheri]|nr:hypothetical protein Bbelb_016970 [Branchiostoma belcheri]
MALITTLTCCICLNVVMNSSTTGQESISISLIRSVRKAFDGAPVLSRLPCDCRVSSADSKQMNTDELSRQLIFDDVRKAFDGAPVLYRAFLRKAFDGAPVLSRLPCDCRVSSADSKQMNTDELSRQLIFDDVRKAFDGAPVLYRAFLRKAFDGAPVLYRAFRAIAASPQQILSSSALIMNLLSHGEFIEELGTSLPAIRGRDKYRAFIKQYPEAVKT